MKKAILVLLLITLTFTLTACSDKPFTPPKGAVFVDSDTITFSYYDGTKDVELYRFDFINDLYYFSGPFDNNINFTAINNYEIASYEAYRLIQSFDNVVFDQLEGDYDGEITLSLEASENNYNKIDFKVDYIYDVDAHYVTDNGLQIIFLYTGFEYENETIIVPTSIFAFTHEIYHLTGLSIDNTVAAADGYDYVNFDYTSYIVPVPHKSSSEVVSILANEEEDFTLPSKVNKTDFGIGCSATDAYCFEETYTALKVFVDESYDQEMIYDFYETYFGGTYIDETFVFYNNDMSFTFEISESNGEYELLVTLYE